MALPPDLTLITVTGTYATGAAAPLAGTVTFTPQVPLQDSTGKIIIGTVGVTAPLNPSGSFSVTLPCTDNANLSPSGWAYLVTENVPGLGRSYYVLLPHTLGPAVDISALAAVSAPPAASAFATANTWTATQTFSGNPPLKIPPGAASGYVLTSDSSGGTSWQAVPPSGVIPPAGDIGGTTAAPTVVSAHLASPLPLAQGGTSAASQQAAINALTGTQSAGKYLRSDGTNAALAAIQAADVPTLNQNTTGTAANVTGTVAIANGGTGQASQQAAVNALTGTQTAGRYLRSDGTNATLSAIQAADVPVLNQNTTGSAGSANALNSATTTVNVSSAAAPTSGQVLTATSGTAATWQTPSPGAVQNVTAGSGTVTLNAASYAAVVLTLTGNGVTLALSGATSGTEASIVLYTVQSGGPWTLTWPAVTWAGGSAPSVPSSGTGIFTFSSPDGGTTWYGAQVTAAPNLPLSVSNGGSGVASFTAYGIVAGGTTLTGALQAIAPGTSGQVLTSNGASALPSMQALPGATTSAAGVVQLDGTAGDIQAVGTAAAAGSAGKAADAGHVHAGLAKLASTSAAGYTLANGTANILSWTAPNDGALHRVYIPALLHTTTAETGGAITVSWTLPDGTVQSATTLFAAGQGTGVHQAQNTFFIEANTTLTLQQSSAMTAGAAVLWADLWGI